MMEVCGKRADIVSVSCEVCLIEGLSTQAHGYCNECDEHMCNICFQDHVKSKLSRNHVLSPLGQSVPLSKKQAGSNEKCKTHARENVKYYCRKHDIVICGDCIVGDHQGCKMDFISNLANQFENSSEFKDIVRKIEKLEAAQKENKTQLDRNRKDNKACLDTALAEIKKFRKYINEHLDKVETEIIFEANKMAKQNDDILDQQEKMLSVAEQDIDDIRNTLDANMIQGETLFIRTKEYQPKLSKADESISLIRAQNAIRGFTFEQDIQLADLIKSSVKLGCLRRDTVTEEEPTVIQKTKQPIETVKPEMTGATAVKQVEETVKPVMTGVTADKQVEAKQSYLLTDDQAPTVQKCSKSADTAVKPVLYVTAGKTVEAKQSYLSPDPRAAGFDVGSRVQYRVGYGRWYGDNGVVTQVDPTGYVTVRWDKSGSETRERAGAEGRFLVALLPD